MKTDWTSNRIFPPEGWLFLPELFSAGRGRLPAREAVSIYRQPARGVAREIRRAADRLCRAPVNEAYGLLARTRA